MTKKGLRLMRFASGSLEQAVETLLKSSIPGERAQGENYRIEERVSAPRKAAYEGMAGAAVAIDAQKHHAEHLKASILLRGGAREPDTFSTANSGALIPIPKPGDRLVRVECLADFTEKQFGGDADALGLAFQTKKALFQKRFDAYVRGRDQRPMFAALSSDLDRFGNWRADWATVLPELLGLAHLSAAANAPRPVALLEYSVDRVVSEPGTVAPNLRFAAPTVLDHGLYGYIFPSPLPSRGYGVNHGCAIDLADQNRLAGELLHRAIRIRFGDIKEVAVLTRNLHRPLPSSRSNHLTLVQGLTGCATFGRF